MEQDPGYAIGIYKKRIDELAQEQTTLNASIHKLCLERAHVGEELIATKHLMQIALQKLQVDNPLQANNVPRLHNVSPLQVDAVPPPSYQ